MSVVIPVRNEADALGRALRSVFAQDYPGPMEAIVADGSDNAAPVQALARGFDGVRVVGNPRRSAAAGLNLAVCAAAHAVVVRLDARCTLPPGYIRQATRTLLRTGAANVGGRQCPAGTTALQSAVALAMASRLGSGGARYRLGGPEGPVDTVFLGVYRKHALLAAGGFDASLQRNQDYELNWRLRQAGHAVWFDPALAVAYGPRKTLASLARQYFDYGRWKRVVVRRHPESLRLRQALPPLVTLALAACAVVAAAGAVAGSRSALVLACTPPLLYAAALTVESVVTLVRRRRAAALLLPGVLATMHLAWGVGFLFAPAAGEPQTLAGDDG